MRLSMRWYINVHVQHHHARSPMALMNPSTAGPYRYSDSKLCIRVERQVIRHLCRREAISHRGGEVEVVDS